MSVKIANVTLTPQTTNINQQIKIEVEVVESDWKGISKIYSSWQSIKDVFTNWSGIKNW